MSQVDVVSSKQTLINLICEIDNEDLINHIIMLILAYEKKKEAVI